MRTILAIGFILLGLFWLASYHTDLLSSSSAAANVDKQWTVGPGELKNVDIRGGSTDMTVDFIKSDGGGGAYVRINGTAYEDVAQKIEEARVSGNSLSLDLNTNKKWGFSGFGGSDRMLHVTVALPEQELLDNALFSLKSGDGDYRNVKGKTIHIGSSSGDIAFNGLTGQDILLECSSGDIEGTGVTGNTRITASSGSIRIDELSGNSSVKSASGDVRIQQKTIANADINATSGNVTFTAAKDFAGMYDVRASSGKVKAPDSKGKDQATIKIRTHSGDIAVKEL
ncbi:DUF4097 family beta strand repeat-containing protein [Paenibacillus thalictri]|uniref:DUF4097 domain-containing protein n=1 Tax=Paenibacillus thalictri TaxID=2527873 RepID=A0A4Q9DIH5_9BACL|nr:DUF4097 family beta strand repeat-containing protein [Paenibacillus thalictri]TBL70442.1 hypothetical protein EYB31_33550 [Paenibacillus thalictri]